MMRFRYRGAASVLALIIGLIGALCYGASVNDVKLWSHIETGGVKIGVETLQERDGEVSGLSSQMRVDREESVSYIPRITNHGAACYIRVSITADAGNQILELTDYLEGVGSRWLKKGGYLYYSEPISTGQSVDVCRAFRLPSSWDYYENRQLRVQVSTDALQARNFTADFTSSTPWGDVIIRNSQIEAEARISEVEPIGSGMQVSTGNPAKMTVKRGHGLLLGDEDFFADVMLLPGDCRREAMYLSNEEKHEVEILMKAEWEKSAFLDRMQLQINDGSELYDGILTGAHLHDYRTLAVIKPGENKQLEVALSFPESAENRHQQSSNDICWCFAVRRADSAGAPMTGDMFMLAALALTACAAAVCGGLYVKRGRTCEKQR